MEYQEKIEWLRRYLIEKQRQRLLMDEIEMLRTEATHITQVMSGMPGGGGNHDKLAVAVERITERQEQLTAAMWQADEIRHEIGAVLQQIHNPRYQEMMRRKYLLGQSWSRIAFVMEMDERWLKRVHHRLVECIEIPEDMPKNIN